MQCHTSTRLAPLYDVLSRFILQLDSPLDFEDFAFGSALASGSDFSGCAFSFFAFFGGGPSFGSIAGSALGFALRLGGMVTGGAGSKCIRVEERTVERKGVLRTDEAKCFGHSPTKCKARI